MKTLELGFSVAALALSAGLLVACYPDAWGEGLGADQSNIEEKVDPLEGAYIKQGGTTRVSFVFKKSDETGEKDTFLGEIEPADEEAQRAAGTVVVSRDNLGTKLTLAATEGTAKPATRDAGKDSATTSNTSTSDDGGSAEAGSAAAPAADAGAVVGTKKVDTRPLAQQAFNGAMHFLRIGKNSTILVRADGSDKTAHYKKVKSWCATDADCDSDVQETGLDCTKPTCSAKSTCVCAAK